MLDTYPNEEPPQAVRCADARKAKVVFDRPCRFLWPIDFLSVAPAKSWLLIRGRDFAH